MRHTRYHRSETPASPEDLRASIDAYAWHAAAASGFGDAGLGSLPRADDVTPADMLAVTPAVMPAATPAVTPPVEPAITPTPAPSPAPLTDVLDTAWRFVARRLEAVRHGWWAWRQARATDTALNSLDDRALRDLGFDRSEISSLAAGSGRHGDPTRVRMSQGLQGQFI